MNTSPDSDPWYGCTRRHGDGSVCRAASPAACGKAHLYNPIGKADPGAPPPALVDGPASGADNPPRPTTATPGAPGAGQPSAWDLEDFESFGAAIQMAGQLRHWMAEWGEWATEICERLHLHPPDGFLGYAGMREKLGALLAQPGMLVYSSVHQAALAEFLLDKYRAGHNTADGLCRCELCSAYDVAMAPGRRS